MPRFDILMKPTAMSKAKFRPEYEVSLEAKDRDSAVISARAVAEREGFKGYAVTKIKEITQ